MAVQSDLFIDQGADFSSNLDLTYDDGTPINVAGSVFTAGIRKSIYAANLVANLTVTVVSNANGNVVISMPANVSSNIEAGRYRYSLNMITTSNLTIRVVEGIITILPNELQQQPYIYTV